MDSETVHRVLKERILSGQLRAGQTCPSEAKLAQEFGMARETMRGVFRRLAQERYLSPPRRGRSRTIQNPEVLVLPKIRPSESFGDYLETEAWSPRDVILQSPETVPITALVRQARLRPSEVTAALGLAANAEVQWLGRLRLADENPVAIQWVVVPTDQVSRIELADLYPGGLTRAYHMRYGIARGTADAQYRASLSTFEEARHLNIAQGSPLIEERRVSYSQGRGAADSPEVAYEYLVSLYPDCVALNFRW